MTYTTEQQTQLDAFKALLSDAETAYAHAIAVGDFDAVGTAKRQVAKYRNAVAKVIKSAMR